MKNYPWDKLCKMIEFHYFLKKKKPNGESDILYLNTSGTEQIYDQINEC